MRNLLWIALIISVAACGSGTQPEGTGAAAAPAVTPTYNHNTGKLEQLAADRSGDGKVDTWAYMDGVRLQRIEIDRDADGRPDRFEHYEEGPADAPDTKATGGARLTRVEEGTADGTIVRREFYSNGLIERVEEDTELTGRVSKWEFYTSGVLARVDLDLTGRGTPTQRLIYSPSGEVVQVESDPDGDGRFEPAPQNLASR